MSEALVAGAVQEHMVMMRLLIGFVIFTLIAGALAPAAQAQAPVAGRMVLGYYVPYDPASWFALEANADAVDIVAVQWVTVNACGGLDSKDNQSLKRFARSRGLKVLPSLLTLSAALNTRLLNDEETAARTIGNIVDYVMVEEYDGFDLDLEGVSPNDRDAYSAFVARLAAALHERGKILALAVPAKTSDTRTGWGGAFDYAAIGRHADFVTLMAYEYSGAWGGPGPIAPAGWVEQVSRFAASQIPPEKVLLGLAFYGYDWNITSGGARSLSFAQAQALSDRYQTPMNLDADTKSVNFVYSAPAGDPRPAVFIPPAPRHDITTRTAEPCAVPTPVPATPTPRPTPPANAIQEHVVWIEEAGSAHARWQIANRHRLAGVATWRIGLEEPRAWTLFREWRATKG